MHGDFYTSWTHESWVAEKAISSADSKLDISMAESIGAGGGGYVYDLKDVVKLSDADRSRVINTRRNILKNG